MRREFLVDDRHFVHAAILLGDHTSGHQRRAESLEIIWPNPVGRGRRTFIRPLAWQADSSDGEIAGKWTDIGRAGGNYARHRSGSLDQGVEEILARRQ